MAILVIWLFDVFGVMAVASRAFATYYALQCVIATISAARQPRSPGRLFALVGFPLLACVSVAVAVFAIAAE